MPSPDRQGLYMPDGSFRHVAAKHDYSVTLPTPRIPLSLDEHLDRLQQLQSLRKETELWQDEIDVRVDTGGFPFFMLCPLSDVHFGAEGTDMVKARNYLKYIRTYPVTTALVGDLGDFFNPEKHPDGMFSDVITPDDQLLLLRQFYTEYKDKILTSVQDPSHTDWIRQTSGIEPQRWISQDLGIPLLCSGGMMNLHINDVDYQVLLFHKIAKFNSSFNRTHAGKRMLELHRDADLVISGHVHLGAQEKAVHRDKKVEIVQLGTFKTEDGFGERNGMVPKPQVFFPTIFFDARRKNIEVVEDMDTAVEFIESLDYAYRQAAVASLGALRDIAR